MYAVRRETSPASGRSRKVAITNCALGEVVERAEVDLGLPWSTNAGSDREAEHGQRDDAADHRAEPERGASRNVAPRVASSSSARATASLVRGSGRRRGRAAPLALRLDLGGRLADAARDVADPEEAEDER